MIGGIQTFEDLAKHVKSLPYGRITHPNDPWAVLTENKGTCSSKHQLLAMVAQQSGHDKVLLMVGIYEMSERNTPGVSAVLRVASIESIPEAHCYLAAEGQRFDFTGLQQGVSSPFDSLLEEHVVSPMELPVVKIALHKRVLSEWAKQVDMSEEEAWALREACIAALAANSSIERTATGKPASAAHVKR